jgi:hypothetical protein
VRFPPGASGVISIRFGLQCPMVSLDEANAHNRGGDPHAREGKAQPRLDTFDLPT